MLVSAMVKRFGEEMICCQVAAWFEASECNKMSNLDGWRTPPTQVQIPDRKRPLDDDEADDEDVPMISYLPRHNDFIEAVSSDDDFEIMDADAYRAAVRDARKNDRGPKVALNLTNFMPHFGNAFKDETSVTMESDENGETHTWYSPKTMQLDYVEGLMEAVEDWSDRLRRMNIRHYLHVRFASDVFVYDPKRFERPIMSVLLIMHRRDCPFVVKGRHSPLLPPDQLIQDELVDQFLARLDTSVEFLGDTVKDWCVMDNPSNMEQMFDWLQVRSKPGDRPFREYTRMTPGWK